MWDKERTARRARLRRIFERAGIKVLVGWSGSKTLFWDDREFRAKRTKFRCELSFRPTFEERYVILEVYAKKLAEAGFELVAMGTLRFKMEQTVKRTWVIEFELVAYKPVGRR